MNSLAAHTTFHLGGSARVFIEAKTETEVEEAIVRARELHLPLLVLGNGSNILVPDAGVEGVVLKMLLAGIAFEKDSDDTLLIAGAGVPWDEVVDAATARELFGIENLAGIPGTLGGAVVQNIGAYGAELSDTFHYADVIDASTSEKKRVYKDEAGLAYRTSSFKTKRNLIITHVALRLSKKTSSSLKYPDLTLLRPFSAQSYGRAQQGYEGQPACITPAEIADAIRTIRANKFPQKREEGTAGSFFKNPIVDEKTLARLSSQYPDLPVYPVSARGGSASGGKISLAWLLDHALGLKGYAQGNVRLFEQQPLVVVARAGATAAEVDAFADQIAGRVFEATGIKIEREVETFGAQRES